MDDRLADAPVGVLAVDRDGVVRDANAAARGLADGALRGVHVADTALRSVDDSLLAAVDGAASEASFEEYYPDLDRWLAVTVSPDADGGATVYLEDVTRRRRHEQEVQQLRAERARTAVIDDLLSDVLAALVDAEDRAAIAETVCRQLGDTDRYEFAWVGERRVGGDGLVARTAAGDTGELYDAVRDALDGDATTPEERAAATGDLQVVQPLAEASDVPDAVARAGFADGVQSALAMPLVYGSNVHGVVGVYAGGSAAFSERERASFETLGEVAGFAVTAARNRSLLQSDTVTAVTFAVEGGALASLSRAVDATLELDGVVAQGEDDVFCYAAVDGADPRAVADASVDGVDGVRVVRDGEDGGVVELELGAASPVRAVATLGATVDHAQFSAGSGRVVAVLPRDGDERRIVHAVAREFDADVAAKRDRERDAGGEDAFRSALADRLTDRQETVLRTAYHAAYFESPRGSTAEEVADTLDITGSTLLYHLRAAQRKLLDAYFEDGAQP